ncbi:hypothetical protein D3C81_754770 [compost metagenome]
MPHAHAADQAVPGLGVVALVAGHELADEVGLLHDAVTALAIEYPVRFVAQVARHQLDQLRFDERLPALAGEDRRYGFGGIQQRTAGHWYQVVEAQRRELPARLQLQAQVFTVYQRAGDHERFQALAGLADQLFVARQGRGLTLLEQLHVNRRVLCDDRAINRRGFAGRRGPGLG